MPNIDLTKIQLIRLYHERLPDNGGLYSIESKVFSFKKRAFNKNYVARPLTLEVNAIPKLILSVC